MANLLANIKDKCKSQGITIKALESAAGLSEGTIKAWGRSEPSVSKVQKVAKVLGVSMEQLLGEELQDAANA